MTYAIDFDGIVYRDDELNLDVCKRINELRGNGEKVVLHTSRQGNALKNALELIGDECEFDDVISGKYYADKYIDDRSMTLEDFLSCEKGEKRMAIKSEREYRMIQMPDMQFRALEDESYIVEGYATTFDDPYVMYEWEGVKYMEQIDRNALTGADMSDVIFLYNHEGMVFARQSNGTLQLSINERGLYVRADLSSTEASRQIYESIKAGLVTQMSWAFTVEEESYNEKTRSRSILKVKKCYDVSAVSIPANPNTDISARSYWDGVIAEEHRRECERAAKVERVKELLKGGTQE